MPASNPIREQLEADNAVIGAQSATVSPAVIEVYGAVGLDFVWIDLEHTGPSPYDSDAIESLVRCAASSGISVVLRPPSLEPDMIRKVLDTGVRNIILPQVSSASELREAISAAYFAYDGGPGNRGSSIARANDWGHPSDTFADDQDSSVLVGAMIENVDAVENIDEILGVPGLGFVRIGYGDLAMSAGKPLEREHPEVEELGKRAETAAREHGVPLSCKANSKRAFTAARDDGYRVFTIGNDLKVLREVFGQRTAEINAASD